MRLFHKHHWKIISAVQFEKIVQEQNDYGVWRYKVYSGGIKHLPPDKEWRTSVYKECITCHKMQQDILKGKHTIKTGSPPKKER